MIRLLSRTLFLFSIAWLPVFGLAQKSDNFRRFLPPGVNSPTLTFSPTAVVGGTATTATQTSVTTSDTFQYTSNHTSVVASPSPLSMSGQLTRQFSVPTNPVVDDTLVTISFDNGAGGTGTGSFTVKAARVTAVSFPNPTATAGTNVTATVTLDGPAATGGDPVNFHTDHTELIVPGSLAIPAGQSQANFTFATKGVDSNTVVVFGASREGVEQTTSLTLTPCTLASASVLSSSINSGGGDTIIVNLNGKAGPSGFAFTGTSDAAAIIANFTGSVPAQASQGFVRITAGGASADTVVHVVVADSANSADNPQTLSITVRRVVVTNFQILPATVTGGGNALAVVSLSGPCPADASFSFNQLTGNESVLSGVGGSFNTGASYAYFTLVTRHVNQNEPVSIGLSQSGVLGVVATAPLTVIPPVLNSLKLQTQTLVGGTQEAGEAYLNFPAATNGAVVTLSSSSADVLVPDSVTIPSNSIGGLFQVRSRVVTTVKQVTITATMGAVTKTITLTLTP